MGGLSNNFNDILAFEFSLRLLAAIGIIAIVLWLIRS